MDRTVEGAHSEGSSHRLDNQDSGDECEAFNDEEDGIPQEVSEHVVLIWIDASAVQLIEYLEKDEGFKDYCVEGALICGDCFAIFLYYVEQVNPSEFQVVHEPSK